MKLERTYEAEAAHQLSAGVPDGHPCKRLHGHRYVFVVGISGDIDPVTGMILEYAQIDGAVLEVLEFVDHRFTNYLGFDARIVAGQFIVAPLKGLIDLHQTAVAVRENSTVENLGVWFVAELQARFKKLHAVGKRVPHMVSVRIQEDSRSVFELWVGEK